MAEKKQKKEDKKVEVQSKTLFKKPRVTEKASFAIEKGIYTFDVLKTANKKELAKEIFAKYKVKPVKVNIVSVKAKEVRIRGRLGTKQGGKKAYVFLKKGDKIDL